MRREVKTGSRGKEKQTVASPSTDERLQSLCQSNGFFQPVEMKEKTSFFNRDDSAWTGQICPVSPMGIIVINRNACTKHDMDIFVLNKD